MKIRLFLFFCLLFLLPEAFSQDLITTKTGRDIVVRIKEVTQTAIMYERSDSVFTIPKAEIFMIKYANGSKVVYGAKNIEKEEAIRALKSKNISPDSLQKLGRLDAKKYYQAYKGAATGTFISTLLFPPAGLVVAISTSSCRPTKNNLNYPSEILFSQRAYVNGYGERAHKKKQEQVWTNFGIGVVVSATLTLIVIPAIIRH
ncbi:hypothetical protein I5M27_05180 [Adhaeribacter sp. BT258]|uniref:Uncharacterized protein n=1 Tax=Adhaeribacter terrigena TaxID=2793070 RepID=A0ABS1BZM2_9BACT|nr:hypothetical protein [Adhaeribacter terrigena]MBK0402366.1 hypothetical protein [Adhaeribacter terrigena]